MTATLGLAILSVLSTLPCVCMTSWFFFFFYHGGGEGRYCLFLLGCVCLCVLKDKGGTWGRNRGGRRMENRMVWAVFPRLAQNGLLFTGTASKVKVEMVIVIKSTVELKDTHCACHFKTQVKKEKKVMWEGRLLSVSRKKENQGNGKQPAVGMSLHLAEKWGNSTSLQKIGQKNSRFSSHRRAAAPLVGIPSHYHSTLWESWWGDMDIKL